MEGGYTLTVRSGSGGNGQIAGGDYSAPTPTLLNSATYGNGRYVIIGSTNRAVSTNLVDWQAGWSDYNATAVAFGQGLFLAVGVDGITAPGGPRPLVDTSVDGLIWTRRAFPTNVVLNAVTFAQGRFVVTGTGGAIFTSTNGVNWEDRSFSNVGGSVLGVAYGGGRFVALGIAANRSNLSRQSTNGIDWVAGNNPGFVSAITYGQGQFVAVGNSDTTSGANNFHIFTSTNGVNWSGPSHANATVAANGVAYGGGRFVAVGGAASAAAGGTIWSSPDGTNWLTETVSGSSDLKGITVAKGNLLMVGDKSVVISASYVETNSPATITGQPTPLSQSVAAGATVVYSSTVTGTGPLNYRWLKDNLPLFDTTGITGTSTGTLTLNGVNATNAGTYQLSVWNDAGSDLSQPVALGINGKPIILLQPFNITGTNNGSTNINVEVVGPAPLSFQWYQAGLALTNSSYISGANGKRLFFTPTTRTNEADFFVVITSAFGSVTSTVAHVSINRAPIVSQVPAPVTVFQGQPGTLTVGIDGTAPLGYQWKFNGTAISGATSQSFTFNSGQIASNGVYTVTVTNAFGTVTSTSASANVLVIGPGILRPEFAYPNARVVMDVAALPDGNFLAAGWTTPAAMEGLYKFSLSGAKAGALSGLTPNNTYPPGFRSIAVLSDTSIVVGGSFVATGGVAPNFTNLVRFLPNGQLDTAFRPPNTQIIQKVIAVAGGKFLALRAPDNATFGFITRYNADGTVDNTFTEIASGTAGFWGLGVQSNGTIWYGANSDGLRKANADGTSITVVDASTSAGRIFVAPDDRIYYAPAPAGGSIVRRRNADGSTNTFGATFNNSGVFAMAFLPNGQIVAGGNFTTANAVSSFYLAMLNEDGSRDPSFNSQLSVVSAVNSILLLPDGSGLLGNSTAGSTVLRIQLYMPDIAIQTQPISQTVNRTSTVTFTAVATGTTTVGYQWRKNGVNIGGATNSFLNLTNVQDSAAGNYDVVATNSLGSRTSSVAVLTVLGNVQFTQQPISQSALAGVTVSFTATVSGATPLTYQWRKNGAKILGATNSSFTIANAGTNNIATYDVVAANAFSSLASTPATLTVFSSPAGIGGTAGTLNTNFVPPLTNNGAASVVTLTLDINNKVLMTGYFTNYGGQSRSSFARLNADLTVDSPVATFNSSVLPAVGLTNGGFAVGGYFSTVNGNTRYGLAFFDPNGSPLAQPALNVNGYVDGGSSKGGFAVQPNGKVVIGGSFTTVNGTTRYYVVRVNVDGSLDTSFVPDTVNGYVTAVAVQPDGKILIGGSFTTVVGSGQAKVARLNADGTYDGTFANTFTIGTPYGFKFQSDGKIILYGGAFTQVGGVARDAIARLNTDGSLDATFDAKLGGTTKAVYDVLVEADDKLVIAGAFATVNGTNRKCVARLNADGTLDPNFATGTGASSASQAIVYSVVKMTNNAYLIGGSFSSYDGVNRPGLAQLHGSLQPPPARAILQAPQPLTLVQGETATFVVAATGTSPLSFQWRHEGTNLAGATNASLVLASIQSTNAGSYDVVITDANGSTPSQTAALTVMAQQNFTDWATNLGLGVGQNGSLDDPDNDGLSNAAEFALGTSPISGGAGQHPIAVTQSAGGLNYPSVQFTRNRSATGVLIQVSASPSLSFSPLLPLFETAQDFGNGLDLVTMRSVSPVDASIAIFFRITIIQP